MCKHNCLATKDPLVAAEWDYEANDGTPDSVMAQSNQPFAWICGVCAHKWSVAPGQRASINRRGCPECGKQAKIRKTKQPFFADGRDPRGKTLLAGWDHERNAPLENFPHNTRLKATSRSSGSAPIVQQGSPTAGLHSLISEHAGTIQAARSVLGMLLANATPCRCCRQTVGIHADATRLE